MRSCESGGSEPPEAFPPILHKHEIIDIFKYTNSK